MNRLLLTILLLCFSLCGFSRHLKGGFFTYTYLGPGTADPSKHRYTVTLTVYMDCNASAAQIDQTVYFSFFNAENNTLVLSEAVSSPTQRNLFKSFDEECLTGDQRGCYYKIITYTKEIELAPTKKGYILSYQRCCRIPGIINIMNSGAVGSTYTTTIPGTESGADKNSSARFLVNDTIVICGGSYFKYPFFAEDPDNDKLNYSFCNAYLGADTAVPAPREADRPPYITVPYTGGFTGSRPLGNEVTINSETGLISGIAPSLPGEYVVTVCVSESKNGVVVAQVRKELHIKVGNCTPIQATLDPVYTNCDDFVVSFSNKTNSPEIKNYFWDFGVVPITNDTSVANAPTYTYADSGTYTLKLVVNRGQACSDSTTALVKVYPGFFPGFTVQGICLNKPTQFRDTTRTRYGVVNSWSWDFNDPASTSDLSDEQHPTYTYSNTGSYNVRFIVTNSKGCADTVFKQVNIIDKPELRLAFKDTLICNRDTLRLQAEGSGNFLWTPNYNIVSSNVANPLVYPATTTSYAVQLERDGCFNYDTVQVRVVDFVTLSARGDTTICLTDGVELSAVTNGLQYYWTPEASIVNPDSLVTLATPTETTTYTITSIIGKCRATEQVVVRTIPYPFADAGRDTTVCFDTPAQLDGRIIGNRFYWIPDNGMNNPQSLNPVVRPASTQSYILLVYDSRGCPKPGRDTVTVTVRPKMQVSAGNDTAVVVMQPLQFNATGGSVYTWTPPTDLNNPNIPNPIGIYMGNFDSIRYKVHVVDEFNCRDSAYVAVKVFRTTPKVFVPTAFTPNRDGKNDTFRPISVGMVSIKYFRVFNRWGQLVFSSTVNGHGWDGRINGKEQGSGTYVWVVEATDYLGKRFFEKGTVTLIR